MILSLRNRAEPDEGQAGGGKGPPACKRAGKRNTLPGKWGKGALPHPL